MSSLVICKSISRGEEITLNYLGKLSMTSYRVRNEKLCIHNFTCQCTRCRVERKDEIARLALPLFEQVPPACLYELYQELQVKAVSLHERLTTSVVDALDTSSHLVNQYHDTCVRMRDLSSDGRLPPCIHLIEAKRAYEPLFLSLCTAMNQPEINETEALNRRDFCLFWIREALERCTLLYGPKHILTLAWETQLDRCNACMVLIINQEGDAIVKYNLDVIPPRVAFM